MPAPIPIATSGLPPRTRPLRIVIADDHYHVREALRWLLESSPDFEVVGEAADGRETVDVVLDHKPDALVLDWRMPGPSALLVIRDLHLGLPAMPIVVLSANTQETFAPIALQAGAYDYVAKEDAHLIPHILRQALGFARDAAVGEPGLAS